MNPWVRATTAATRLLVLLAVLTLAWQLRRGFLAFKGESLTFSPPRGPISPPTDATEIRLSPVTFSAKRDVVLNGWYLASLDGTGIVLAHGSGATRVSMLDEARILAGAGHGVLLFDFPGHGESQGMVEFGTPARDAVVAGVDFLSSRPEINQRRLGALGFSDGGIAVAAAAAADRRIRAVALVATPADAKRQTVNEYRAFGPIAVLGAVLAYRVRAVHLERMRAEADVAAIAPHPLAIFGGRQDGVVHLDEALHLYASAHEPKQLFVVEHGDHGAYARTDTAYARELRQFFASSLRSR
jgi:dipeptidyl aminopeptidase/acylaminoacyl peptidase